VVGGVLRITRAGGTASTLYPTTEKSVLVVTCSATGTTFYLNSFGNSSATSPLIAGISTGGAIGPTNMAEPLGRIYELATWNRALSAAEVASLFTYYNGKYPPPPPPTTNVAFIGESLLTDGVSNQTWPFLLGLPSSTQWTDYGKYGNRTSFLL